MTKECIMLKDEIEKLIHNRYLRDYVYNGSAKPHTDQSDARPPHEIKTIFGGPHFVGEMQGSQNHYVWEARDGPFMNTNSSNKRPTKQFREEADDITFNERDAHYARHPHYDALVVKAMIANNNVHRMLVDNGSSIDILYYQAF